MTDETTPVEPAGGDAPASVAPELEQEATDTSLDVAEHADETPTPDKPKGGFQRRIQELVSERNEARRILDEERRRVDQLVELMAQRQEQPKVEPQAPPTLEAAGYDEAKYQAAVIEYAKAEARKEAQEALRADREQTQVKTRQQTFKAKEAEYAATVEDYADVVYDRNVPISQTMAELIAESDLGPQLAYHLAKNRDVASAIYGLPPVQAAREIGRIEAKLATPKAEPRPVTQTPPPPPQIRATEPEVERDPESMSMNEWIKWREKQIKRKQGR